MTNTNSFDPQVRLFGPTGALLSAQTGGAEVIVRATAADNGVFTVVVTDGSSGGREGVGDFQIKAIGIRGELLQLCPPIVTGQSVDLAAVGGTAEAPLVIFTSTNVGLPKALWTPVHTNRFDRRGTFRKSDFPRQDPDDLQRFFLLRQD